MEFNTLMFIALFIINIVLCIKPVPILGLVFGFLTIVLTGVVFMQDLVTFNLAFNFVLIAVAFSCMLINGLDMKKK